jgi:hypothetical protein
MGICQLCLLSGILHTNSNINGAGFAYVILAKEAESQFVKAMLGI